MIVAMVWAHVITNRTVAAALPFWRIQFGTTRIGSVTVGATHQVATAGGPIVATPIASPDAAWRQSTANSQTGDRSYYTLEGTTYTLGDVDDSAYPPPDMTTGAPYDHYLGIAQADGTITRGAILPTQSPGPRPDDPDAFTYNQTGLLPDDAGYDSGGNPSSEYGGVYAMATAADGTTYVVCKGSVVSPRIAWLLIARLSGGALSTAIEFWYEWRRISAATITDPYHPPAAMRFGLFHLHLGPGPVDVSWGPWLQYYTGDAPALVFGRGPMSLWRAGPDLYGLVPCTYGSYTDSQQGFAIWRCPAGADPTLPASWLIHYVNSFRDLTLPSSDPDYNRSWGQNFEDIHWDANNVPQTQMEQVGGITYFGTPTRFRDSAGWLPPVTTVVWQMDGAGAVTGSFDLPAPGPGLDIYAGSLCQIAGTLYYWTYTTTSSGFPATNVLTIYHLVAGAWTLLVASPTLTDTAFALDFDSSGDAAHLLWLSTRSGGKLLDSYHLATGTWARRDVFGVGTRFLKV